MRARRAPFAHSGLAFSHAVVPFADANIEQASLDFTGIDPFDPDRGAIDEGEALRSLFSDIRQAVRAAGCKRAILVGHNAFFDHGFLFAAAERQQIKRNPFHPFSTFDTVTLAGMAFGQTVLAKACAMAGIVAGLRGEERLAAAEIADDEDITLRQPADLFLER